MQLEGAFVRYQLELWDSKSSETQGAGPRPARAGTGAGAAEGRGRAALGRVRPSSSWLPEPLGWGRYKTQAQLFVPRFCGTPEGAGAFVEHRRARTARSAGTLHREQPAA